MVHLYELSPYNAHLDSSEYWVAYSRVCAHNNATANINTLMIPHELFVCKGKLFLPGCISIKNGFAYASNDFFIVLKSLT